jgi:protein sidekick
MLTKDKQSSLVTRGKKCFTTLTSGFDGNSSITKWTVQALSARNATWTNIYEVADPEAKAILVKNLIPYMDYQLRVIANNVVGASEPSEPTRKFQTIQAPPSHAPRNVTIRAMSATQLRVRWIPLSQGEWFGIPRGYNISYRILVSKSLKLFFLFVTDSTAMKASAFGPLVKYYSRQ